MNKTSLTDILEMAREGKIRINQTPRFLIASAGEMRLPSILTGKNLPSFVGTKQKTNAEVIVVTDKVHFIPNMYGVGPYTVVMLYTTVFR